MTSRPEDGRVWGGITRKESEGDQVLRRRNLSQRDL